MAQWEPPLPTRVLLNRSPGIEPYPGHHSAGEREMEYRIGPAVREAAGTVELHRNTELSIKKGLRMRAFS